MQGVNQQGEQVEIPGKLPDLANLTKADCFAQIRGSPALTLGKSVSRYCVWMANLPDSLPARLDNTVEIKLYGSANRDASGGNRWQPGVEVLAVPYDVPIPGRYTGDFPALELTGFLGYNTINTNNIRLWRAQPKRGFNLQSFNAGDYDGSVREGENAETSGCISQLRLPSLIMLGSQSHESCTPMTSRNTRAVSASRH